MNNIIHNIQRHIQHTGVLLTRRNDVTTRTRKSQGKSKKSRRAEDKRGRGEVKTGSALLNVFPSHLLPFFAAFVSLWCVSLFLPLEAMAGDTVCAEVKIEIQQELTLERQAFEAHMRIDNALSHITLENVSIVVNFTDEDGNPVEASSNPNSTTATFFIRLDDVQNIGAVDGTGTVSPSSSADIYWLIIPAPGASAGLPEGKLYYVGATLTYSIGGETHVTEVLPDYIYVKPMPLLFVDYFLPKDVYGDDAFTTEVEPPVPFSLGVRVDNRGYGSARQLTIDSADVEIVENEQGLLVDVLMQGSEVNGQAATPSLSVAFGDIEPNTSGVARWNMTCSLSGWFKDFSAEFSHADELGGDLTSLIEAVNTHFLIHDVLVDLPGRDGIRDFLATASTEEYDRDVYRVYESESRDAAVSDLSDSATLTPVMGETATYTLALESLTQPSLDEEWFLSVHQKVPGALGEPDTWPWPVSAVRSDGKLIAPENVWISKTRKSDPQEGWEYFVNLFDAYATTALSSPDTLPSYTLVFEGTAEAPQPPVLQPIPDQTGLEGAPLFFTVEASCAQGLPCTPLLSATPLPVGADFTDHGDGTGTFAWTPAIGQNGLYFLTVAASDGDLITSQPVTITITALPRYTITATAGAHGSITPSGAVMVPQGTDQAFTITPDDGYHIVDVLIDGASVEYEGFYDEHNFVIGGTVTFISVETDHTLEAVFAIKTYPILATAGDGGSIEPSGALTVEHGSEQSFTITPESGYYVDTVFVDGVSVGAVSFYTFSDIAGPHTIEVVFSTTPPTPTPTPEATATSTPTPEATATPTATPEAVTISGRVWTSDGTNGLPEVALNGLPGSPTTNDLGYYQAEVAPGWSGTVTPQKLDYGFTPVFRSYSSLMLDQDQQDYTGTAPSQTLTIVLTGEGSGVVTGDGGIDCGTLCTATMEKYTEVYLSVIPEAGSIVAGVEGAVCTAEGTCVLTISGDTTVTVTFDRESNLTPTPTMGPEPTPTSTPDAPIPEPATGVLVLVGLLAALFGLRLRCRRPRK